MASLPFGPCDLHARVLSCVDRDLHQHIFGDSARDEINLVLKSIESKFPRRWAPRRLKSAQPTSSRQPRLAGARLRFAVLFFGCLALKFPRYGRSSWFPNLITDREAVGSPIYTTYRPSPKLVQSELGFCLFSPLRCCVVFSILSTGVHR